MPSSHALPSFGAPHLRASHSTAVYSEEVASGYHAIHNEQQQSQVSNKTQVNRKVFSILITAAVGAIIGVTLTLLCMRTSFEGASSAVSFTNKHAIATKYSYANKAHGRYTYNNVTLPMSNTTTLAVAETPYFLFVFALGKDRNVHMKYVHIDLIKDYVDQDIQNDGGLPWSEWTAIFQWNKTALMDAFRHAGRDPNNITDADMPHLPFDSDPAVGVNADGRVEVFARYTTNLDVWQTYQLDARDPTRWSNPRESGCIFVDPPSNADGTKNGGGGFIPSDKTKKGEDKEHNSVPDAFPECDSALYWNGQPVFPTSDLTIVQHPATQKLRMFFRGFTGQLYFLEQMEAGNSTKYGPPIILDAIMV